MGPEEFHRSVLICLGDLLAEQFVAQTAILFSSREKVGWIRPVSHLFQQLDCAEIDDFLRFLPAVFSIVSAICGLPLVFRHQLSASTAGCGEMRGRREIYHRSGGAVTHW